MGSKQMIDENCASADASGINALSDDDRKVLKEIVGIYTKRIRVPCASCMYCMQCPSGVNIPQNFAILNNVSLQASAKQNSSQRFYTYLIKRGYKKMAGSKYELARNPGNGNALVCTKCGRCMERCPQARKITTELEKVHEVLGKGKRIDDVFTLLSTIDEK